MRLIVLLALLSLVGAAATLDSEENTLLALINDHRQAHGVQSLVLNDQLVAAAEWMSNDMVANNYFSHTDSLGRNPFQRMADFGYDYNTWKGENLTAGADTAQIAFRLFKGSPWHNANMLNANFEVIGIARASGATYGWYWTVDFGGQATAIPTPTPSPTPTPAITPAPTSTPAPPIPVELPSTGME